MKSSSNCCCYIDLNIFVLHSSYTRHLALDLKLYQILFEVYTYVQ